MIRKLVAACLAILLSVGFATAQETVYENTMPDGKVIFSDQPIGKKHGGESKPITVNGGRSEEQKQHAKALQSQVKRTQEQMKIFTQKRNQIKQEIKTLRQKIAALEKQRIVFQQQVEQCQLALINAASNSVACDTIVDPRRHQSCLLVQQQAIQAARARSLVGCHFSGLSAMDADIQKLKQKLAEKIKALKALY